MNHSRRSYRLTRKGLKALRKSIQRNRPWEFSTGPRTLFGKSRTRMNALKHGERSAATVGLRRLASETIRRLTTGGD